MPENIGVVIVQLKVLLILSYFVEVNQIVVHTISYHLLCEMNVCGSFDECVRNIDYLVPKNAALVQHIE